MSENHTPKSRARKLRKEMTEEEKLLWKYLRNRNFKGLKFLRQHPIVYDVIINNPKYFIADFYCSEKKLIVEIDGKIHNFQKNYDENRDEILTNMGLRILRIRNEEVAVVSEVLRKIEKYI